MRCFKTFVVVLALSAVSLPGIAGAMNKGELIDAVAKEAGLTQADAGDALNAFAKQVGKSLKSGYSVQFSDFGSFSLAKHAVRTDGCGNEVEVEFIAGALFKYGENPLYEEAIASKNTLYVEYSSPPDSGLTSVYGWTEGAFLAEDEIIVLDVLEGVIQPDSIARGKVVDVILLYADGSEVIVDAGEDEDVAGLRLRGIEKSDIRRGMVIAKASNTDGNGDCPDEDAIVRDEDFIALTAKESQLREDILIRVYNAMLDIIIDVVNSGEEVDIEGFGAFYEAYEIEAEAHEAAHVVQRRRGRNPQTGKEIKVAARGLTDTDIKRFDNIIEAVLRAGRNPQTGKEIKIAAKKVAKFKAGKALADTVK